MSHRGRGQPDRQQSATYQALPGSMSSCLCPQTCQSAEFVTCTKLFRRHREAIVPHEEGHSGNSVDVDVRSENAVPSLTRPWAGSVSAVNLLLEIPDRAVERTVAQRSGVSLRDKASTCSDDQTLCDASTTEKRSNPTLVILH